MTVRLDVPFRFDCAPGEEKRVDVVAHAPLPAPMAQRFNLDRLVALGGQGEPDALAAWVVTALRVMDGQNVGDIISVQPTAPWTCQGPVPAVVFACTAVGTALRAPFGPGDTLTCVARNVGPRRATLSLTGVVRPSDWLFFCLACGASVWTANPHHEDPEFACDVCGYPLFAFAPADGDAWPRRRPRARRTSS